MAKYEKKCKYNRNLFFPLKSESLIIIKKNGSHSGFKGWTCSDPPQGIREGVQPW